MYYEINTGKTNSERFSVFLKNLFKKDIFKLQSMLCIMDNARLHKTKQVIHIQHIYTFTYNTRETISVLHSLINFCKYIYFVLSFFFLS